MKIEVMNNGRGRFCIESRESREDVAAKEQGSRDGANYDKDSISY